MLTYQEIDKLCHNAVRSVKKYENYKSKVEDEDMLQSARLGAYTAIKYSKEKEIKNLPAYVYTFARGYILHTLSGPAKKFNNTAIAFDPHVLNTLLENEPITELEDEVLGLVSQIPTDEINRYLSDKPVSGRTSKIIAKLYQYLDPEAEDGGTL